MLHQEGKRVQPMRQPKIGAEDHDADCMWGKYCSQHRLVQLALSPPSWSPSRASLSLSPPDNNILWPTPTASQSPRQLQIRPGKSPFMYFIMINVSFYPIIRSDGRWSIWTLTNQYLFLSEALRPHPVPDIMAERTQDKVSSSYCFNDFNSFFIHMNLSDGRRSNRTLTYQIMDRAADGIIDSYSINSTSSCLSWFCSCEWQLAKTEWMVCETMNEKLNEEFAGELLGSTCWCERRSQCRSSRFFPDINNTWLFSGFWPFWLFLDGKWFVMTQKWF